MQPCLIFWTGLGMRLTHNLSCICIIKPWTPSHKVSFVLNWSNSVKNAYQYCRLTILDIYLSWSRWRWWVSCVLKWKLHELCYTICNLNKVSAVSTSAQAYHYCRISNNEYTLLTHALFISGKNCSPIKSDTKKWNHYSIVCTVKMQAW